MRVRIGSTVLVLAACLVPGTIACDGEGPRPAASPSAEPRYGDAQATAPSTPVPTLTPGEALVLDRPAAYLLAGGGRVTGAHASACSHDGQSNLCADVFGVPSAPDPFLASTGAAYAFEFELGPPSRVVEYWWPAPLQPVDNPGLTGPALLWMPAGEPIVVRATTFPATAGRYLLKAIATYDGRATLEYGWYIEVR